VYKNELAISSHSMQIHSRGETTNIMSAHANHVGSFSYIHDLWLVPLRIGMALLVLGLERWRGRCYAGPEDAGASASGHSSTSLSTSLSRCGNNL
jgi:hypothetical protein